MRTEVRSLPGHTAQILLPAACCFCPALWLLLCLDLQHLDPPRQRGTGGAGVLGAPCQLKSPACVLVQPPGTDGRLCRHWLMFAANLHGTHDRRPCVPVAARPGPREANMYYSLEADVDDIDMKLWMMVTGALCACRRTCRSTPRTPRSSRRPSAGWLRRTPSTGAMTPCTTAPLRAATPATPTALPGTLAVMSNTLSPNPKPSLSAAPPATPTALPGTLAVMLEP